MSLKKKSDFIGRAALEKAKAAGPARKLITLLADADVQLYDSGHPDQANPSTVEVVPGRFLTLGFDVQSATVVGVFTEPDDYPR